MAAPKLNSREDVKRWLENRPREDAVALAVRAALRVAPLAARARTVRSGDDGKRRFVHLASAVFRATALARGATEKAPRASALRSAADAAADAASAFYAVSARYAAADAADAASAASAADAASAASAASDAAAASAASDAAAASAASAADAASASAAFGVVSAASASASAAEIWREFSADAAALESGTAPAALVRRPLWSDAPPAWAQDNWRALKNALPADQDWDVWFTWYENVRDGRPTPEAYDEIFLTVPEHVWDEGPAAANAWIKARLEALIPPAPPAQGPGLHVMVDGASGAVVPAGPGGLDPNGDNIERLRAQHPLVVEFAAALAREISANEQPALHLRAARYCAIVNRPLEEVDFERLWGEGLYLENAADAAARNVREQLSEPLSDAAQTALGALLALHPSFIMATRVGVENLAAANAYRYTLEHEAEKRRSQQQLLDNAKHYPDVIAEETRAQAEQIDAEPGAIRPDRTVAFRAGLFTNLTITISAVAIIGAISGAVTATFEPAMGAVAAFQLLTLVEGLKKSKPFLAVSGLITEGLDNLSETDYRALWEKLRRIPFARYRKFVLDNAKLLMKAVDAPGGWLRRQIDWLKSNPSPDPDDGVPPPPQPD